MKKKIKNILHKINMKKVIIGGVVCSIIALGFIFPNVLADTPNKVIKIDTYYGIYGALYESGDLYTWGRQNDYSETELNWKEFSDDEKIVDFIILDKYDPTFVFLTETGKTKKCDLDIGYDGSNHYPIQTCNTFEEDGVTALYNHGGYSDGNFFLYLKDNTNLWIYEEKGEGDYQFTENGGKRLINENVKDIKVNPYESILYRTENNDLYALGANEYGKKINDGNFITEPLLLMNNIKEYDSNYAITNDNALYIFNKVLPRPTLLEENVKTAITGDDDYSRLELIYKNSDDINVFLDLNFYDDEHEIDTKAIIGKGDISNFSGEYFSGEQFFVMNDILYKLKYEYDYENDIYEYVPTKILDNVKTIKNSLVITYENELYSLIESPSGLNNMHTVEINEDLYKLMDGVKDVTISNEFTFLISEDEKIYAYGENYSYNNIFNNLKLEYIGEIALVEKLPNTQEDINIYDLEISTGKRTELTIDNQVDYYVNIIPYNAKNRNVVWKSSNIEVATVDSEGKVTAVGEGTAIISVETENGTIKSSEEIHVYPKVNKVEFAEGDNVEVETYEPLLLTVNIYPDNTLEKDLIWEVIEGNEEDIYLNDFYYDEETDESIELTDNKKCVRIYSGGTYKLKVTTANGLYSDTITITTIEEVDSISLDVDDEHFDGVNNVFIFMSEDPTLQVGYKVYPTTATNQNVTWKSKDESIATVDSTGKITAYKVGRTQITISSVDGGATRTFNVLVYDYTLDSNIVGDVNGDGNVDILDVIKLRRYLAGLEETL